MRNEPKPLSKKLLRKFAAGELNDAENEAVLSRLAEDEASLEFVDALWHEQTSPTAVPQLPNLKPEKAQQMRQRLLRQLHRTDLSLNVVKMGTQGFGSVAVSLLRPLLDSKNRAHRNRRRRKP
jgi:hypothetical protein